MSCNTIQPLQFRGQTDCSLVCTSISIDMNNKDLVRYSSQVEFEQHEKNLFIKTYKIL